MQKKLRVLVVDDIPLFREMLVITLSEEEDVEIVGEAKDGEEAIEIALETKPDVIVLDVEMPKLNGIEVTKRLSKMMPECKIVILTAYEDDELIFELIQSGATGYLVKDTQIDEVVRAVRIAHEGESLIQPRVAGKILKMMVSQKGKEATSSPDLQVAAKDFGDLESKLDLLTQREREVLEALGRGLNNRELADFLGIGQTTVKTHVKNVLSKLELRDRVEAVLFAVEAGIL